MRNISYLVSASEQWNAPIPISNLPPEIRDVVNSIVWNWKRIIFPGRNGDIEVSKFQHPLWTFVSATWNLDHVWRVLYD